MEFAKEYTNPNLLVQSWPVYHVFTLDRKLRCPEIVKSRDTRFLNDCFAELKCAV